MPDADQEKIAVIHYLQQVRKNINQLASEERSAVLLIKLSDGVICCRKTGVIIWPGYQ
jgi:DNA-directed RNA polymerase specialized sigma24 family protein